MVTGTGHLRRGTNTDSKTAPHFRGRLSLADVGEKAWCSLRFTYVLVTKKLTAPTVGWHWLPRMRKAIRSLRGKGRMDNLPIRALVYLHPSLRAITEAPRIWSHHAFGGRLTSAAQFSNKIMRCMRPASAVCFESGSDGWMKTFNRSASLPTNAGLEET